MAFVCLIVCAPMAETNDKTSPAKVDNSIPYKKQPAVGSSDVRKVAFVLVLSIGISLIVVLCLRTVFQKRGLMAANASTRISLVSSRRIGPKLTVFLLEIDGQGYVVVQSGSDLTLSTHSLAEPSNE